MATSATQNILDFLAETIDAAMIINRDRIAHVQNH
jgi:hypothetical protein